MNYLVSILIPAYNVEKYIEKCVISAVNQEYKNIEIIIINDGSTDKTLEICSKLGTQDKRIKIFSQKNQGLSAARIVAVNKASGEFIFHLDGDDSIPLSAIKNLVEEQKIGNFDLVFGDFFRSSHEGILKVHRPIPNTKEDFFKILCADYYFPRFIWGVLIRKELYISNDIRPTIGVNMGEDFQVLPKLVYYSKKYSKIDFPVYTYNQTNPSSMCKTNSLSQILEERKSFNIFKDFLQYIDYNYLTEDLLSMEKSHLTRWLFKYTKGKYDSNSYKIIYNIINSDELKKIESNNSILVKIFQKIKYFPIAKTYAFVITFLISVIKKYNIKYNPHSLKISFS